MFQCSFECKHFGLQEPEFPVADELKTDIEEYESNWVLFEQFNNGLGELTKEDWISFRLVFFDEFCIVHVLSCFNKQWKNYVFWSLHMHALDDQLLC